MCDSTVQMILSHVFPHADQMIFAVVELDFIHMFPPSLPTLSKKNNRDLCMVVLTEREWWLVTWVWTCSGSQLAKQTSLHAVACSSIDESQAEVEAFKTNKPVSTSLHFNLPFSGESVGMGKAAWALLLLSLTLAGIRWFGHGFRADKLFYFCLNCTLNIFSPSVVRELVSWFEPNLTTFGYIVPVKFLPGSQEQTAVGGAYERLRPSETLAISCRKEEKVKWKQWVQNIKSVLLQRLISWLIQKNNIKIFCPLSLYFFLPFSSPPE